MLFTSKANTLIYFKDRLKAAKILPILTFTYQEWCSRSDILLENIITELNVKSFIVRSSCSAEDSLTSSMAGYFTSILNVRGRESLKIAIDKVYQSYSEYLTGDSQILIQPMLENVAISGVAFSVDPNSGGHYYVVNYDPVSGNTESVTGSAEQGLKVDYWYRYHKHKFTGWRSDLLNLMIALRESCPANELDIEFAYTQAHELYLLQVRPLVVKVELSREQVQLQQKQLRQLQQKIHRLSQPHPYLCGKNTLFANMPDWNPAEIIGTRPSSLALSLYKELVTDSIWAHQRHNYGYRNLQSFPLLICFAQSPYIDTRVSFNSFIPASLDPMLADKLVNYYLERLEQNPYLQDKVEFDIVLSCYHPSLQNKYKEMLNAGFSTLELQTLNDALLALTNNIFTNDQQLVLADITSIDILKVRQQQVLGSSLNKVEKIYWLIEDCKRHGTLPFAGIARAAFISRQFLSALVELKCISDARAEQFLNALHTVGSEMLSDLADIEFAQFIDKYGHLRPGTYDICSLRYDEMPSKAFKRSSESHHNGSFKLSSSEIELINEQLQVHQIDQDAIGLFHFFKQTIEGREKAKFVFSKSISQVLLLLQELGNSLGYSRDSLSYLDIKDVMSLYSESLAAEDTFKASIERHKKHCEICQGLMLPPVISHSDDVYAFTLSEGHPNFVTRFKTKGLTETDLAQEIQNKIVFIPSADPGFDWIFSHDIKGFITMYGGVNSHMAIRACELGIPAVIGAGEILFKKWSQCQYLSIDCKQGKVESI